MPGAISPRRPLEDARFFLGMATTMTNVDREELRRHLMAAVVFGRSVYHYLSSPAEAEGADPAYRAWFRTKADEMRLDPLLEHFRNTRDVVLKEAPMQLRRNVTASFTASARISAHFEARVIRGQPWYRRSPRIWWQDARSTVLRPVSRWRYRAQLRWDRWREGAASNLSAMRRRFERPPRLTVGEYLLDDPEGLNRSAVELVAEYLDRLEAIVSEAESSFAHVFR
jgi:hypothetical protein